MNEDEQSIRQIAQQLEYAWNQGDGVAFAAAFAEDAEFIDVLGEYHKGRAIIEAGHRQILTTFYKDSRNEYTVEGIRFIRPDVAVAFIKARLISHLAVGVDDPNRGSQTSATTREDYARPTMVLAKDRGRWQIVTFQNTRIAAPVK
jgi:uncharacterized protein (TIGR02246 family)